MGQNNCKISVITATYNAGEHLPRLAKSLLNQTDKDFEWVVADGASDDGTLEALHSITGLDIVTTSQPDFGIYDALNRAIKMSSGEYYIVAGADDIFYPEAIASFRRAIESTGADIISAKAKYGQKYMSVKQGPSWLYGQFSYISAHVLATAVKKDLHRTYGYFSRQYPIAADQYFVLRACQGGASRHERDFVAGEIGRGGISSVDRIGNATEVFRVQVATGHSMIPQLILFILRVLRAGFWRRDGTSRSGQ